MPIYMYLSLKKLLRPIHLDKHVLPHSDIALLGDGKQRFYIATLGTTSA